MIAITLCSCASFEPSAYGPAQADGYGITITEDGQFKTSVYTGNTYTGSRKAERFSRLGALEHCRRQGKLAVIVNGEDKSSSFSYTGVSSYNYTTPGYTTLNGSLYRDHSKDITHTNVYSYPVVVTYPEYDTKFKCVQKLYTTKDSPKLETVPAVLVSPYSKDFRGGVLVKEVSDKATTLKQGDVVIKVDGKRIETAEELSPAINVSEKPSVSLTLIRNHKIISRTAPLVDVTVALKDDNKKELITACTPPAYRVRKLGRGKKYSERASMDPKAQKAEELLNLERALEKENIRMVCDELKAGLGISGSKPQAM